MEEDIHTRIIINKPREVNLEGVVGKERRDLIAHYQGILAMTSDEAGRVAAKQIAVLRSTEES